MANAIYEKMKAAGDAAGRAPFMDTADVAKCLRVTLKARFPGCKFSVRISRYSGGSSIDISWTDGPAFDLVDAIARQFEGKSFDGMIDMAYYKAVFLLPDGSAEFAGTNGTAGSMGVVQAEKVWKPSPEAIRVQPSCYVFCRRDYSAAALQRNLDAYAAKFRDPLADAIRAGDVWVKPAPQPCVVGAGQVRVGDEWGDVTLYRRLRRRMLAA